MPMAMPMLSYGEAEARNRMMNIKLLITLLLFQQIHFVTTEVDSVPPYTYKNRRFQQYFLRQRHVKLIANVGCSCRITGTNANANGNTPMQ